MPAPDPLDVLKRVPYFDGKDPSFLRLRPLLGGQHNILYVVEDGEERYVLRLGRKFPNHPDHYLDEEHNTKAAVTAGVAADILHFDREDGVLLYRFVVGIVMDNERFRDLGAVRRAGQALRKLHDGPEFRTTHDLFSRLDRLRPDIEPYMDGTGTFAALPRLTAEVARIRRILAEHPVPLKPCHNDPVPENYIDTGSRMVMIDWQCSGQADPYWELGALMAQAGFRDGQDDALTEAYFGHPDHPALARAELYKAAVSYHWMVHHLSRLAAGEEAERRRSGAIAWMKHCDRLLGDPAMGLHIEAVRSGAGLPG
jgi:thiamine kinase-like enzyme